MLTVKQIIKIVNRFSKPDGLAVIKADIKKFYSDIGLAISIRTKTITPFIQRCEAAFNPENITNAKFKKFIMGLSKMLYAGDYKIDSLLKAKWIIKKLLFKYNNETSKFYKFWYDAKLYISDEEFVEKRTKADRAVYLKNQNVYRFGAGKVKRFYESIFGRKDKDIIDYIIGAQAALGTRLIEILNPDVSQFEAEDGKIIQHGTAKLIRGVYKTGFDKELIKTVVPPANAKEVIQWIEAVHSKTNEQKSIGNIKLAELYIQYVNKKIVYYLKQFDMLNNELKSSHGLRRLYVAYMYYNRVNQRESLASFIMRTLGHETAGSIMNYNSIQIYDDSEDDQEEKTNAPLPNQERNIRPLPAKSAKQLKMDKIESLINQGFTTYKQMAAHGITTNAYLQYKKMKLKEQQEAEAQASP